MKIVVVGVGALGSNMILAARNVPATWRIIDFDRVEKKNVLSQFHTNMSVGKNKALALQQALQGFFGIKVEAFPHKLTADNATQLLSDADLVIDCLDNGASRKIVQDLVRARNIPCLHGALAPNGEFGRIVWDEAFVIDSEAGMGAATCEDGAHLPFITTVSAQMAVAIQRFVAQGKKIGAEIHPNGIIRT